MVHLWVRLGRKTGPDNTFLLKRTNKQKIFTISSDPLFSSTTIGSKEFESNKKINQVPFLINHNYSISMGTTKFLFLRVPLKSIMYTLITVIKHNYYVFQY